jgi:hypothetical protein
MMTVVTVPMARRRRVAVVGNKSGAVARYLDKAIPIQMDETTKFDHAKAGNIHPHHAAFMAQETRVDAVDVARNVGFRAPRSLDDWGLIVRGCGRHDAETPGSQECSAKTKRYCASAGLPPHSIPTFSPPHPGRLT